MAEVVALLDDLIFQAKVSETAQKLGVDLKSVTTPEALLAEAQQQRGPALFIVDLNARAGLEAIERLRATGDRRPVVAFLSHVQVELAERARAAGCAQVLPRSQFTRDLPAILSQAKAKA